MRTIYDRYDKSLMASLTRALFPGRIEVIFSEDRAKRAVEYLMNEQILGFDTETRPSFKRGMLNKVALLQVSTEEVCFLFRLNQMGIPACLTDLLGDNRLTKVGLAWHDDLHGLQARQTFDAGTFIDLQNLAAKMGIEDRSLQKLYANICGQRISKGQQLSNWEADSLSDAQMLYAATDAWACIQLYKEMTRLLREGFQLKVTENEQRIEENHTSEG